MTRADRRSWDRRGVKAPGGRHGPGAVPRRAAVAALALATGVASPTGSAWAGGRTERVDVATGGAQANGLSFQPSISRAGRYVAFDSSATNLVPGDTNGTDDVFVRDRVAGTTERVSVGLGGVQANGSSTGPVITPDGRFVAFVSYATNLVPGDTNNDPDLFVRDRRTGRTERVSVATGGVQGNNGSVDPEISAGGRFVAFISAATNLVPGDTNEALDVFVRDRLAGTTERVSVGPGGIQANEVSFSPVISAGGRFVAFDSRATNLVPGDTNGADDVFVRDRAAGTTERVSLGPGGAQANDASSFASISADGRFVAFDSFATNLGPGDTIGNVFVRDRRAGTTELVSVGPRGTQANAFSLFPVISAGGRFVAFDSWATNLVPGDTNEAQDVFVRDRRAGTTERVSVGPGGRQANDASNVSSISPGGSFVTFVSDATNLVPGDTNNITDVFVRAR